MFKPGDIIKYNSYENSFIMIILEHTNIDYKVCVLSGNYYPYIDIEGCNQSYILTTDIFEDTFK